MLLYSLGWLKRSQMVLPKAICQFEKETVLLSHLNSTIKRRVERESWALEGKWEQRRNLRRFHFPENVFCGRQFSCGLDAEDAGLVERLLGMTAARGDESRSQRMIEGLMVWLPWYLKQLIPLFSWKNFCFPPWSSWHHFIVVSYPLAPAPQTSVLGPHF